jgi:hypothetical protein
MGLQPNSVCTRADGQWTCTSYARVDPFSAFIGMAVDAATFAADSPGQDFDGRPVADGITDALIGGSIGLYNYITTQPMLQFVSEMAEVLTGPQNPDDPRRMQRVVEVVTRGAVDSGLNVIPFATLRGGIERAMDPRTMETRNVGDLEDANANPLTRGFNEALTALRNRTPGMSGDGVPRLNIYGQESAPTAGGVMELLWPFRTTQRDIQPADLAMYLLASRGGPMPLAPPGWVWPGTNIRIPADVRNEIIAAAASDDPERSGATVPLLDALNEIVTSPRYEGATWADRADMMREEYRGRLDVARRHVLDGNPRLAEAVARQQAMREILGTPPRNTPALAPSMPAAALGDRAAPAALDGVTLQ